MSKLKSVSFTDQAIVVLLTTFIGVIGWLTVTIINVNTTMARIEERMIHYDYRFEYHEERITKLEDIYEQLSIYFLNKGGATE